jgi:hypothetical protein
MFDNYINGPVPEFIPEPNESQRFVRIALGMLLIDTTLHLFSI